MPLIRNPRWVFKYIFFGTVGVGVPFGISLHIASVRLDRHNDNAREVVAEKMREAEAKQKKLKALAEVKAAEDAVVKRATQNWDLWRTSFTNNATDGIACYHAKKAAPELKYVITCSIGPKGKPPNMTVVCDQNHCQKK